MRPYTVVLIFREIVAQHERQGAEESTILDGIDYREKMGISDSDLRNGINCLVAAHVIESRGDRWFVAPDVVAELPRTESGALSIFSEAWRKFAKRRIEPLFRPSNEEL
jgi:hypothetical protein